MWWTHAFLTACMWHVNLQPTQHKRFKVWESQESPLEIASGVVNYIKRNKDFFAGETEDNLQISSLLHCQWSAQTQLPISEADLASEFWEQLEERSPKYTDGNQIHCLWVDGPPQRQLFCCPGMTTYSPHAPRMWRSAVSLRGCWCPEAEEGKDFLQNLLRCLVLRLHVLPGGKGIASYLFMV